MMIPAVDILLTLILLSVLFSLGSSRIMALIKIIAFQGIMVSLVPLLIHPESSVGSSVFYGLILVVRGIAIPCLLMFVVGKIAIRRSIEPYVGYNASLAVGLMIIVFAIYITGRLNLPVDPGSPLVIPAAITLLLAGLFLLMARRKAVTMVIGYLVMENGIYLMGSGLAAPIVEFGILLDVLVGVMLMGIFLHNIQSAFDDIDTTLLRTLKD
jgi:hydrogenase-4 component E